MKHLCNGINILRMHFIRINCLISYAKIQIQNTDIPYCLASYGRPQVASPLLFQHRQQWLTPAPPCSLQQPVIFIFLDFFWLIFFALPKDLSAQPGDPLGLLATLGLYHRWWRLPGSQQVVILQKGIIDPSEPRNI